MTSNIDFNKRHTLQTSFVMLLIYITNLWNPMSTCRSLQLNILKAFNKVWHLALHSKLRSYGVSAQLCTGIKNPLSDPLITIAVDGPNFSSQSVNASVLQNSVQVSTFVLHHVINLSSTSNHIDSKAHN